MLHAMLVPWKSTGWHAIHYTLLPRASRLIASLREIKVRAVPAEAHFKLLAPFSQAAEASGESREPPSEWLFCLFGGVIHFSVGRFLCVLLCPGVYWAGMRADAPKLCGQCSHWFDCRACSWNSHRVITPETTAGGFCESPQKCHQELSTSNHEVASPISTSFWTLKIFCSPNP